MSCKKILCSVQRIFLLRADIVSPPWGYSISSVQNGAPVHASCLGGWWIVDRQKPLYNNVERLNIV